jgi:hypothetical protein
MCTTRGALGLIKALDALLGSRPMDSMPTLVASNYNLHHADWSTWHIPNNAEISASQALTNWANMYWMELQNKPGVVTWRGQAKQRD